MEIGQLDCDEVVVEIPGGEHKKSNSSDKIEAIDPLPPATNIEVVHQLDQDQGLSSRKKMSPGTDSSGIEIPKSNLIPTPQQANVVQSHYPKPKPGSTEWSDVPSAPTLENDEVSTPTSPILVSPWITLPAVDEDEDDNDDDIYSKVVIKQRLRNKIKHHLFSIKSFLIISTATVLILSKTLDKLENLEIWIFELWEWCVLLLAILCGRFLSSWCLTAIVLLIETQFRITRKFKYFIHSVRKSIRVFIWIGFILLTWQLLIKYGVRKSRGTSSKVVKYITRGIGSTLVVTGLWIFRTLLVKMINSSIYVGRYFERIQEDIFCHCILQTLSGPPLVKGSPLWGGLRRIGVPRRLNSTKEKEEKKIKRVFEVLLILDLTANDVSVSMMRKLIKAVRESEFPNPSGENGAYVIFKNVAKPGHKYISQDDLLRFIDEYAVKEVLARIGGDTETTHITEMSFINWVENAYENHKGLVLSMKDIKSAIKELNKFVTGITVLVLIIIWLIITKIATTEVLLFISSQLLLAIFTFGASAKSTFEAIIFVFVKYPFDVGDRCVVDGVQVVVEEVNILTTVFSKYDNEKIYYPNSELALKAISNFNRSPDMGDFVDFDLDVSTSNETISVLKAKIQRYIEFKPQFWRPNHVVRVKEIQDVNKMKMSLGVIHTINFQNYAKRNERISELVEELKKFFEDLDIKYYFISPRSLHDGSV